METTNIDSVEEFSLFALERSAEGIDTLCEESRRCAQAIQTGEQEVFQQISSLADGLHAFDVFQNEICALFMLENKDIADSSGTLNEARQELRNVLDEMAERIGTGSLDDLPSLLRDQLPEILMRLKALMPVLHNYINDEYLQPA